MKIFWLLELNQKTILIFFHKCFNEYLRGLGFKNNLTIKYLWTRMPLRFLKMVFCVIRSEGLLSGEKAFLRSDFQPTKNVWSKIYNVFIETLMINNFYFLKFNSFGPGNNNNSWMQIFVFISIDTINYWINTNFRTPWSLSFI